MSNVAPVRGGIERGGNTVTRSLCFCTVLLIAAAAYGQTVADSFVRVSAGESLVAPFVLPAISTRFSYGGTVEVIVSGTGYSYGGRVNDAFYGVPSGIPVDYQTGSYFKLPWYQMNIGWQNGFGMVGCEGEPHNINNFITFINGTGPVTAPAMPAYHGVDHTYDFVVTVAADAGQLLFGVSDCHFEDNGGQYNIQVFQLAPLGAPTPTASQTPSITQTPPATASRTTTASPTTSLTPRVTATPTPSGTPANACLAAPRDGCYEAHRASGIILNARARTLRWKWLGSAAPFDLSQFGDPVNGSTVYQFCIYDTSAGPPGLALAATVPGSGTCGAAPCWTQRHNRFFYLNAAGTPDGVRRMTLTGGSGQASIVVSGHGSNLHMPRPPGAGALLREFPAVIVQLQRADSPQCWQSVFLSPATNYTRWNFSDLEH